MAQAPEHPHGGPPGQTGQHPQGGPPGRQDERRAPGVGPAAQTPQQDHTPRQEEQQRREERERRAAAAPKRDEKAEAELAAARRFNSIGAQVILDYNGMGSIGARGGAGGDIVENQMARDKWLYDLGLDPVSPSGPPPPGGREYLDRRAEVLAKVEEERPPPPDMAGRVSSLAAGDGGDDKAARK